VNRRPSSVCSILSYKTKDDHDSSLDTRRITASSVDAAMVQPHLVLDHHLIVASSTDSPSAYNHGHHSVSCCDLIKQHSINHQSTGLSESSILTLPTIDHITFGSRGPDGFHRVSGLRDVAGAFGDRNNVMHSDAEVSHQPFEAQHTLALPIRLLAHLNRSHICVGLLSSG
jgi:hypothetical protein